MSVVWTHKDLLGIADLEADEITLILDTAESFREVAERLGVSIQRVHQLVETYSVAVVEVNPRFKLIPADELKKIPSTKKRQSLTGKHLNKRQ